MNKNKNKNFDKLILYGWIGLFLFAIIIYLLVVYNLNFIVGIFGFLLIVIFIAGIYFVEQYIRKHRLHLSIESYVEASNLQRSVIENIDLAYALTDINGDLLWMNDMFSKIVEKSRRYYKNISTVLDSTITKKVLETKNNNSFEINYNTKSFLVKIKKISINIEAEENVYIIYLIDNTEVNLLNKRINDEKLIQGLIYIDNYDDAMHDVDDIRKSLMASLLDRRIRKYFIDVNGVIQKFDKDKYYILLQNLNLAKLQSDKFNLLEEVKKLNVGNQIPLTLSMGFSESSNSFQESYEQAVSAVDMALARGGDQVVVKKNNKVYYYGGRAKSVEKNTRVRSRVKAHALKAVFENRSKVIIMGHKIPDIDCVGAAIGVYTLAQYMQKEVHIVVNELISSVRSTVDKFINDSKYPDNMFISPDEAIEMIDNDTTLVIVDVNKPGYTEVPELIDKAGQVVVIDHHRQGEDLVKNPVLSYVETSASSTCEMITEVLQYFTDKNFRIDTKVIDALYAGILIDTNYFANRVGVRTFEAAAYLKKCGADLDGIRKMLRDDPNRIRAKATVISDAYIFREGFIIGSLNGDELDSPTEIGAQAANELLNANGMRASFVLTRVKDTIYVSLRSIDDVNVQLVAESLGGGGHQTIAGAQLTGIDIDEAKNEIINLVNKMLDNGDI